MYIIMCLQIFKKITKGALATSQKMLGTLGLCESPLFNLQ